MTVQVTSELVSEAGPGPSAWEISGRAGPGAGREHSIACTRLGKEGEG